MAVLNPFAHPQSSTKFLSPHYIRVPTVNKRPSGHKLTQNEENSRTEWIIFIDTRGAAPKPSTVRDMANILLTTYSDSSIYCW